MCQITLTTKKDSCWNGWMRYCKHSRKHSTAKQSPISTFLVWDTSTNTLSCFVNIGLYQKKKTNTHIREKHNNNKQLGSQPELSFSNFLIIGNEPLFSNKEYIEHFFCS